MSKLRRYNRPGQMYFVTMVTKERRPFLRGFEERLISTATATAQQFDTRLEAWVVMPDHVHMLLEPKDGDISGLIRRIKLRFSDRFRKSNGLYHLTLWQRRFWDHIIRDSGDLVKHIEYIHFNPVKHGLVNSPIDWPYSSFHQFLAAGLVTPGWGRREIGEVEGDFGE